MIRTMKSVNPIVAIAQLPMFWSRADNLAAMLSAIAASAAQGAQIVVLSELAITGFHREIGREADSTELPSDISKVREAASRHRVAVVFGSPTFEDGGQRPFNSHLHVDPDGGIQAVVSKRGLTSSEATFFSFIASAVRVTLAAMDWSAVVTVARDSGVYVPTSGRAIVFPFRHSCRTGNRVEPAILTSLHRSDKSKR